MDSRTDPVEKKFSLSEPLTVSDLEDLYHNVVLKQEFYGDSYGSEWTMAPYEQMAAMLAEILKPAKHIDVGCGKGFLVLAMRQLGIASFGVDYSEALIKQAPAEIQPYLQVAKTEDWLNDRDIRDADLITYMEVFEHLPVATSEAILQALHNTGPRRLLITTPSYGVDERLGVGLVTNPTSPGWREDMARNRPFREIVLWGGIPHHGHITLCSYRWWTEFFLSNGWTRCRDLECQLMRGFKDTITANRWNPYILESLLVDNSRIEVASSNQLGGGWHDAETGRRGGRWTNGFGELFVRQAGRNLGKISIQLSAPSVDVIRDYWLVVVVAQQTRMEHEFTWRPIFTSLPLALQQREATLDISVELPLPSPNHEPDDKNSLFRITLISPTFSPKDYGFSSDQRNLGVFVTSVNIQST